MSKNQSSGQSGTTGAIESAVAASQTDTGAPNDQRAAANPAGQHATQTHGSPTPDGRTGATLPPRGDAIANTSRAAADASQRSGTGLGERSPSAPREGDRFGNTRLDNEREENDGAEKNPNAKDGAIATSVNEATNAAGKKLHDETPTLETSEVLKHSAPSTPLAAQRSQTAPVIHAPTVTPKGKLGYMATPSVPENGAAPGVAQGGPAKADFFTKPIVPTSISKSGTDEDRHDTEERSGR